MKNKNLLIGLLAITLVFAMTAIGCDLFNPPDDNNNNNNNTTAVTFNSVTADGSSSQTTTQLTLTFSQAITGLSASNITLSGVSGVSKGTLSSSGTTYTLPVSGFTTGGTLSVAVAKSGYTISGSPKTVTVYYNNGSSGGGDNMTWTAVTENPFSISDTINSIVYANNKFIAVSGVKMATSTDGVVWAAITDSTFRIYVIAYGNNKFIAGGEGGKIATSTDGTTWTTVTTSTFGTSGISAIAYGNNKFVAGVGGIIATSTDGVTWTAVDVSSIFKKGSYDGINAIAYGNNKFIAVGHNGNDYKMAYSSDGETWTPITTTAFEYIDFYDKKPYQATINGIVYGNNRFVAIGSSGVIAYSTDGETWTAVADSKFGTTNNTISAIAYGNGKFVAGGSYGKMAFSSDGTTWTAVTDRPLGSGQSGIAAIAYGNGKFVASSGLGSGMAYSSDGTGNNGGGGGGSDVLNGTTWRATNSNGYYIVVTFNSPNWSMEDNTNNGQIATQTGTYTVSGNTVTLTILTSNGSTSTQTGTISGNTISLAGWPTFTKQ